MTSGMLKGWALVVLLGVGMWKVHRKVFGPAVEAGKVTILDGDNFRRARQEAKLLLALYMRPG